jgi:tetratricopeptide (TPR) repeat protein
MRRHLTFLLLSLLFWNFPASADFSDFSKYHTAHFDFYSDLDKEQVDSVLEQFEVFRAAVYYQLQLDPEKAVVPVSIYVFKNQRDYDLLKPKRNVVGFFRNTVRGPLMIVGPTGMSEGKLNVLFHEYVHFLLRATQNFSYPTWYEEGLAELYSSIEITADGVVIGGLIGRRLAKTTNANFVELEELLTTTNVDLDKNSRQIDRFYGTSWLLSHFLSFGHINGFVDYRQNLSEFLILQNQGVEPLTAFEKTFPISLDELQKQLKQYNRIRVLKAALIKLPPIDSSIKVSKVEQGQMYANMSHLAFSSGNSEDSTLFLNKALELQNLQARSVKSFLLVRAGEYQQAKVQLDSIVQSKDKDPEVLLNIGQAYMELAVKQSKQRDEMNRLAMYYLQQATEQGSEAQAHVFLARLYWQAGQQQNAVDEIAKALKIMPSDVALNFYAGEYMAKLNNKVLAKRFLGNVVHWSQSKYLADKASGLLSALD